MLVYHARDYAQPVPDPLNDPTRHTRMQPLRWKPDGTPDIGPSLPNGPVQLEQ